MHELFVLFSRRRRYMCFGKCVWHKFVFLILLCILKVLCSLDASLNGNTIVLVISSSISLSI